MKEMIKNIGAVLMAIVVLFSTMSFTIHNKYCNDELIDTALYLNSDSCESDEAKEDCLLSDECCSQEKIVVFGQNELQSNSATFSVLKKYFFVTDLTEFYLCTFKRIYHNKDILKQEYSPPILIVDTQSIHQVFVI